MIELTYVYVFMYVVRTCYVSMMNVKEINVFNVEELAAE